MRKIMILNILTVSTMMSGCFDQSSDQNTNKQPCLETGQYACKAGETEPLYTFQWALNYKDSFFKKFKEIWKADSDPNNYDLNVESVHKQGLKGQGINVIVLDDAIDIRHEDLAPNVNLKMTYNFVNFSNDPTPPPNKNDGHGTNVSGIIVAAQNGKGVMGIAPKATLGGGNFVSGTGEPSENFIAYGGAEFSKYADIFNASFGNNPDEPDSYNEQASNIIAIRAITHLRQGKGAILIKSAGNEFVEEISTKRNCLSQFKDIFSCENVAHEIEALEPTAIMIAAANAKGVRANYSNAGSLNWVTGLAGESSRGGEYGEGAEGVQYTVPNSRTAIRGPSIFSTDLVGCNRGYSRSDVDSNVFARGLSIFNGVKNNPNCDYSQMGGTSSAAPTVTGVTALILQANPNLTWRDVREIISRTSRKIDLNYDARVGANRLVDLMTGQFLTQTGTKNDIKDGATQVPLEFGWQTNATGAKYSNWYGFGLIDAAAAVKLAQNYKSGSLTAPLHLPEFATAFANVENLSYGKVTRLGSISITNNETIDQFQLSLSGPLCVGSVGIFVKSPSGVISTLSIPYNIHYKTGISTIHNYGLGSYAFYGEQSRGQWEVFAVSGNKGSCKSTITASTPLTVKYRIIPKS